MERATFDLNNCLMEFPISTKCFGKQEFLHFISPFFYSKIQNVKAIKNSDKKTSVAQAQASLIYVNPDPFKKQFYSRIY